MLGQLITLGGPGDHDDGEAHLGDPRVHLLRHEAAAVVLDHLLHTGGQRGGGSNHSHCSLSVVIALGGVCLLVSLLFVCLIGLMIHRFNDSANKIKLK